MSNKIDIVTKIEGILMESDLQWTIAYLPSTGSYSIYISDEDSEIEEDF